MAEITYTITNNSPTTTATIRRFVFANQSQIHHVANYTGWNSPWSAGGYNLSYDTRRSENATYISDIGDVQQQYKDHINTSTVTNSLLRLDSITGIEPGYEITGNGYTAGQTVVSTSGTTWVIASADPDGTPVINETITFVPPEYVLQVNSITGIELGWVATGNGYSSGQTVVSTSGTQFLIMSDQPNGTPSVGGTISFVSIEDAMIDIPPSTSKTFALDYVNDVNTIGSYTGTVQISGDLGTAFIKNINNFLTISAAPVIVPDSPFYGGSGSSGGLVYDGGSGQVWRDASGNIWTSGSGQNWTTGGTDFTTNNWAGGDTGTGSLNNGVSSDGSGNTGDTTTA